MARKIGVEFNVKIDIFAFNNVFQSSHPRQTMQPKSDSVL